MKFYNILLKQTVNNKVEDVMLIKEGFSYGALFFSFLWFLYYKMWREILALAIIFTGFSLLADSHFISGLDQIFLHIATCFVIGINAGKWLESSLLRRGYEFNGIILGNDQLHAQLRLTAELENAASNADNESDQELHFATI